MNQEYVVKMDNIIIYNKNNVLILTKWKIVYNILIKIMYVLNAQENII